MKYENLQYSKTVTKICENHFENSAETTRYETLGAECFI